MTPKNSRKDHGGSRHMFLTHILLCFCVVLGAGNTAPCINSLDPSVRLGLRAGWGHWGVSFVAGSWMPWTEQLFCTTCCLSDNLPHHVQEAIESMTHIEVSETMGYSSLGSGRWFPNSSTVWYHGPICSWRIWGKQSLKHGVQAEKWYGCSGKPQEQVHSLLPSLAWTLLWYLVHLD